MPALALNNRLESILSFEEVEEMLFSFSASLLKSECEDEVYRSLAQNVISILGFEDCVIYTVNNRSRKLVQRAAYGYKSKIQKETQKILSIPMGQGIPGLVATTGIAERISDKLKDPRCSVEGAHRRSKITIPIKLKDKVIGLIDCEHRHENFFTDQHLRMLSAVSSICAIKLSHIDSQKVVKRKESKLLLAKQEMAELKIKAIRAQMNPHFVFNALNAIQHFIIINDKQKALRFLSAFSKLVRLYLKHVENDVINLFHEMNIIEQYLKLQRLRYDGMFDYNINYNSCDSENIMVPAFITQLIIEEGVENLAKNKLAGKMNIDITIEDDQFAHVIIDIAIPQKGGSGTNLKKKYANEFTNWSDHVSLLKKIKRYKIKIIKLREQKKDIAHHIMKVVLPCL